MLARDSLNQIMHNVGELCSSQIACSIDVDGCIELSNRKFLRLYSVSDLAHDFEDQLNVMSAFLDLNDTLCHLLLQAACTYLGCDIG